MILKKGEGRTLKAGGAWIFDNEIDKVEGTPEDGSLVEVRDFDGYGMGTGFYNSRSKIRVRMMSRKAGQVIDRDFLRMRVQDAWDYRKKTVDTSSCRIIFGEADFLPGLVVDKFSDVLVRGDPGHLRAQRCQGAGAGGSAPAEGLYRGGIPHPGTDRGKRCAL